MVVTNWLHAWLAGVEIEYSHSDFDARYASDCQLNLIGFHLDFEFLQL